MIPQSSGFVNALPHSESFIKTNIFYITTYAKREIAVTETI